MYTLPQKRPVGAKDSDVLTHSLDGYAADDAQARWVLPPVSDVLTLFVADYQQHAAYTPVMRGVL